MKTRALVTVLLFSLISGVMKSQNVTASKSVSKYSQEYLYADDLLIKNAHYSLSCKEIYSSGLISYCFELKKDTSKQFFTMMNIQLVEKSISVFQSDLITAFKKLNPSDTTVDSSKIKIIASDFLTGANLANTVKSDSADVVGGITVNPKVILFKKLMLKDMNMKKRATIDPDSYKHHLCKKHDFINEPADTIEINKVEIKFEYEQITGIKVIGTVSDRKDKKQGGNEPSILEFQNNIPISYSSKKDVSNDQRSKARRLYEPNKDTLSWINFGDIIRNDYRLMNQTENYSPTDQVMTIKPGDTGKVLKKTPVTNLLTAAVFTDLVGLNSLKPNGLVQFEISHRFYLNRRVYRLGSSYSYVGLLNSVRPKVTFSKLESNNRTLDLKGDSLPLYTEAINIYKHTSWSSGGEINLFYLGLPAIHSMIYINAGVYILNVPMRIPASDTTLHFQDIKADENRMFNKGFLNLFPEVYWVISPQSRFQIGYSIKYNWLKNLSHDYVLVTDNKDSQNEVFKNGWTSTISFKFLASLRLSSKSNNELFFRSCYNYMPKDPSQSYFQAQLGYSFNILDKNIEPPPLKPFQGF